MSQNKNKKRDELILKKIQTFQEEINQGLKRHGITQLSELQASNSMAKSEAVSYEEERKCGNNENT